MDPARKRTTSTISDDVAVPTPRGAQADREAVVWPATLADLLRRLRDEDDVDVVRRGEELDVLLRGTLIATLPVRGNGHRGIFQLCAQLREGGVDVTRRPE